MSVKRTVARTRCGSGAGRTPVRKSWISADDRLLVAGPDHVVDAGQLDELRAGYVLGEIASVLDAEPARLGSVDDERRHPDPRQEVPHVTLVDEPDDRHRAARTGGLALVACPGLPQLASPPGSGRTDRS